MATSCDALAAERVTADLLVSASLAGPGVRGVQQGHVWSGTCHVALDVAGNACDQLCWAASPKPLGARTLKPFGYGGRGQLVSFISPTSGWMPKARRVK